MIENAYLRKAEENPNFCETHKKVMYMLMHERKYYTKDELLCFAAFSQPKLNSALKDLEKAGIIKTEGWLVKLSEQTALEDELLKDIIPIKTKIK